MVRRNISYSIVLIIVVILFTAYILYQESNSNSSTITPNTTINKGKNARTINPFNNTSIIDTNEALKLAQKIIRGEGFMNLSLKHVSLRRYGNYIFDTEYWIVFSDNSGNISLDIRIDPITGRVIGETHTIYDPYLHKQTTISYYYCPLINNYTLTIEKARNIVRDLLKKNNYTEILNNSELGIYIIDIIKQPRVIVNATTYYFEIRFVFTIKDYPVYMDIPYYLGIVDVNPCIKYIDYTIPGKVLYMYENKLYNLDRKIDSNASLSKLINHLEKEYGKIKYYKIINKTEILYSMNHGSLHIIYVYKIYFITDYGEREEVIGIDSLTGNIIYNISNVFR